MAFSTKALLTGGLAALFALLALVLLIVAIAIAAAYPTIRRNQVEERVTVVPGHATYEQLKEPTLPIWKSFYFFNLTNPEAFAEGETPVVKEIGPYSYREFRTKNFNNESLFENRTKLNYTQDEYFHFDQNASGPGLTEADIICTVNLPLVGAVAIVDALPDNLRPFGVSVLNFIFDNVSATLHMCVEATPLAWNFTNDLVHQLHTNEFLVAANLSYPTDWVSIQHNNSVNDTIPSIIHTGVGDINRIGQFQQWNGHVKLDIWANGTGANDINGTEGLFFHPYLNEGDSLEVFIADAVRTFPLQWNMTISPLGLKAFRYHIPLSVYENASTNPENAQWFSWCPRGLFYLGVTQWPVLPIFGSKPHFLDGDPELREKVHGLHPNRSLHNPMIDVEPITGATVQFKQQFQINLQMNQSSDFKQLMNVSGPLYFPVLYIDEHAELTPDFKDYLESEGLSEIQLLDWLIWLIFALLLFFAIISGLLAAVFLAVCINQLRKTGKYKVEGKPLLG